MGMSNSTRIQGTLVRLSGSTVAGIHSMVDKHLGVVTVEYMAAGAILIGWHSKFPTSRDQHWTLFWTMADNKLGF
ncbi:hypothetical protein SLEP1_g5914 [Rubroshorea leprosula]|uniref:Uncharacterized protein n=1 Tax=Rubroshorea leprosula TaxID=152421 RepID=A0AAV5I2K4_9ROSI|nr:hypothetical protein SLEP1_g5914 [Rubroshorea leprosula]